MWRHCVTHFEWDLNRFIFWSWLPKIIAIWQNLIVFVNCCCYLCCCCCCCYNDNIKSDVKNGLSKVIEKNWIFQRKQQKMRFPSHFWRRERKKNLKYKFFPSNFFLPSLRNRFWVEKKSKWQTWNWQVRPSAPWWLQVTAGSAKPHSSKDLSTKHFNR